MAPDRPLRRLIALLMAGLSTAAFAVPRIDLEAFAHDQDVSNMQLSPDGKYFAFMHDYLDRSTICCEPVGTMNARQFDMGVAQFIGAGAQKSVADYAWISDDRLILTTVVRNNWFGVAAANRDASEVMPLSGLETVPHTATVLVNLQLSSILWANNCIYHFDDEDRSVLMLDQHTESGPARLYPDVVRVDTMTGSYTTVVKNPGKVRSWGVDRSGRVRTGLLDLDGTKSETLYRDDEISPWRKLDTPKELRRVRGFQFDADNRHLLASALSPEGRTALYRFDPNAPQKADLILSDPEYDIIQEEPNLTPRVDGISLARVVFSEKRGALLGVWYLRDAPRVQWYDKDFASFQRAVDRAMPDTMNLYVNHSRDERRVLFFSFSDRDPGTYVLVDVDKRSIRPVAKRMPQIDPGQMAQMLSVQYAARDGLAIHGYLTLPVGYSPKHLPLVVMPHGGPAVRDIWEFDPLVQFLANRGFAVLQMNYRGSPGYGQQFYNKGMRQVGAAIQDDIEDATKWALAQGIADPARIAILGGSYGGYSALFALGHNPGLYKCGISIAGVTDWMKIYRNLDDPVYKYSRRYWNQHIGDPRTDEAFLKSVSPVNFADRITAPLLIIQGEQDFTVPSEQAHELIAAMDASGRKPESLFISDDSHYFTSAKARREGYKAIESFLVEHLGPGVPPT